MVTVMKKNYERKGYEALSQAGGDPVGRFILRLLGPGVRKELGRLETKVSGMIGDVSAAFLEAEGEKPRRKANANVIVVDAEIVDPPKK
jgi:hypothetical protein